MRVLPSSIIVRLSDSSVLKRCESTAWSLVRVNRRVRKSSQEEGSSEGARKKCIAFDPFQKQNLPPPRPDISFSLGFSYCFFSFSMYMWAAGRELHSPIFRQNSRVPNSCSSYCPLHPIPPLPITPYHHTTKRRQLPLALAFSFLEHPGLLFSSVLSSSPYPPPIPPS